MVESTSSCATRQDDACASTESMPGTASPRRW